MSKAEKFIQDYTKNCSNTIYDPYDTGDAITIYAPWLTPDQARWAVKIAREELIEKVYDAFCKTCKFDCNCNHRKCYYLNNFKQAMKDE